MGLKELKNMVARLRSSGYLKSKKLEEAMLSINRANFVPESLKFSSYDDCALPIGHGQTISAPNVVALMIEKLEVNNGANILEIGTGSGYNAAIFAELVGRRGKVTTIEAIAPLTELAKANIKKCGKDYQNIIFVTGDGSEGYYDNAPYDGIIVTAAMPKLDESHPLLLQLKKNGRLVAPVGDRYFQELIFYDKRVGVFENILPVVFVPLIGKYGFNE